MLKLPEMCLFSRISGLAVTNINEPWTEEVAEEVAGELLGKSCILVVKVSVLYNDLFLLSDDC